MGFPGNAADLQTGNSDIGELAVAKAREFPYGDPISPPRMKVAKEEMKHFRGPFFSLEQETRATDDGSCERASLGDGFLSGQNGKAIPATGSAIEASTRGVVVVAHAPTVTLIRIKVAANMLILRISILLLITIMITAHAVAALASLTRVGIVRMSGIADLVSLVS